MNSPATSALVVLIAMARLALAAEHTKDSIDKVKENMVQSKAILIDVRELDEWNRGHLADARHLPLSELKRAGTDSEIKQKLAKNLPKEKIVYCHCASGRRVLVAGDILGKLGHDIRPLAAGYDELREAGFPAAKR